ncbi:Zn-ribbon domain-containing OB-fold protein [Sphingomonas solaris]|uniref:Acyl dehydratase n=1 Tax=Alterirhizorhabdus solaris TaxID=2529389 RepID=A0A558RBM8_9SPHN|nr:zinc ribbon domain-containing protein [Sphingomonas solaris]TVV76761.1 acyl dehydratase [Sphingomonas solaris]
MTGAPPIVTEVSRPWWEALARGEVCVQQCTACDHWIFYPRPFCPRCGARDPAWRTVDGAATLYTWSVARVPVAAAFAHLDEPILAVAELAIGIRVPTSLCDIAPQDVRIGMALAPVFDGGTYPGITLLRYRPA